MAVGEEWMSRVQAVGGVVIIGFQGTGLALIQGRQKAIQIVDIERWRQ